METISFASLPALGAELQGGIFAGITTQQDGTHVAVILLPNKTQERLTWGQATRWAEEVGGQLPTRQVAALLYANAKDHVKSDWHWTCEEQSTSYARYCSFYDGHQYFDHKSYGGRALAVRLTPLTL